MIERAAHNQSKMVVLKPERGQDSFDPILLDMSSIRMSLERCIPSTEVLSDERADLEL